MYIILLLSRGGQRDKFKVHIVSNQLWRWPALYYMYDNIIVYIYLRKKNKNKTREKKRNKIYTFWLWTYQPTPKKLDIYIPTPDTHAPKRSSRSSPVIRLILDNGTRHSRKLIPCRFYHWLSVHIKPVVRPQRITDNKEGHAALYAYHCAFPKTSLSLTIRRCLSG